MVWLAIRDDARQRQVDEDSFLAQMWGESLLKMNDAFWGALVNFSQPPEMLSPAKNLLEKTTRVLDKRRAAKIAELEALTEEQIEQLLEGSFTASSMSSADTSGPTPKRGRTAK